MKHTYEGDKYRVLPHRSILDSSMYSVITGERVSEHFEHVPCGALLRLDRDILDANWCPHCAATINQAAKRRANAEWK